MRLPDRVEVSGEADVHVDSALQAPIAGVLHHCNRLAARAQLYRSLDVVAVRCSASEAVGRREARGTRQTACKRKCDLSS